MSELLNIIYIPTADLIPYINNSRTHSDDQINQVAASIKEFGFTNPILIDGDNGVIAGHGRLLAANKLGVDTVPTIELKGLSEAQKKAYIIADNKLALNAGWNDELLSIELEGLRDLDFDLSLIGFNDAELAAMTTDNTDPDNPEDEWDGMPEFNQNDETAFRSIKINFVNQSDVDKFAQLLDQNVTDKTQYLWFPYIKQADLISENYTGDES